jgi:FkbM family methyltransferase
MVGMDTSGLPVGPANTSLQFNFEQNSIFLSSCHAVRCFSEVIVGSGMTSTTLGDGTRVFCLKPQEAKVLDSHIEGYMHHGIRVQPGDTVFDVGANIGMFGMRMAQQCNGDIRVIAFEPIPAIRACAERNLEPWDQATVLPYGVSRARGEATFTFYPNAPSLSSAHLEDWEGQEGALEEAVVGNARNAPMWYAKYLPRFLAKPIARWLVHAPIEVHCELRTLSEIIEEHHVKKIDLLKIDCEGAEEEALLGLTESDWARVQQAVIEVHDIDGRLERIEAMLRTHGLTDLIVEKEPALENTRLSNVYAHRPRPQT